MRGRTLILVCVVALLLGPATAMNYNRYVAYDPGYKQRPSTGNQLLPIIMALFVAPFLIETPSSTATDSGTLANNGITVVSNGCCGG